MSLPPRCPYGYPQNTSRKIAPPAAAICPSVESLAREHHAVSSSADLSKRRKITIEIDDEWLAHPLWAVDHCAARMQRHRAMNQDSFFVSARMNESFFVSARMNHGSNARDPHSMMSLDDLNERS